MSKLPSTIGKYRVERELGRGASGTVYLARDGFRDARVAIKQIHEHLLADPTQAVLHRRMFRNEAALAGQLSHPHIVSTIDADEQAHPPYLVLEYIDGQSLESFTRPDTLLPVADVLDIAFKCCNALEYALTKGLVHRDIKPANLLLRKDGELKLTDFGTALSLHSKETQMGGFLGSPPYMSPEQIKEARLTHHTDMFSLGVVLYELLTGRKPFLGDTDYATVYQISTQKPAPLRVARPELPAQLDAVVNRALAKATTDRYATWSDFANALVAVNRGLPRQASQGTEAERFQQLRGMDFFAGFDDAVLWQTLRLGKWYALPRGTVLMREGTPGESFSLLLEGRAVVSHRGLTLSRLSPGVSMGEMVYLQAGKHVRTATVVAETDIVVMKIQCASLRQATSEVQGCFDKAFIKMLVARLIATNGRLAEWDISGPSVFNP